MKYQWLMKILTFYNALRLTRTCRCSFFAVFFKKRFFLILLLPKNFWAVLLIFVKAHNSWEVRLRNGCHSFRFLPSFLKKRKKWYELCSFFMFVTSLFFSILLDQELKKMLLVSHLLICKTALCLTVSKYRALHKSASHWYIFEKKYWFEWISKQGLPL